MAHILFLGVIYLVYYSIGVLGIELPEGSPDRTTVCAGDPLRGSCPSGDVIAVIDVEYGTKLTATCGLNVKTDPCCNYDPSDCFATYTDKGQQSACSGKEVCTEITIAQADVATSCDQSSYPGLNHYVTMRYHCISEGRINAMCGSGSQTVTGSPLYLKNQDYPNTIRAPSTSCSCSIEASTCISQIQTYFVHLELADGSGSCTDSQKIKINDTGSIQTYTCSQNTNYDITLMMTSSSNYITIELENSAAINDGKFWFGFEGTDNTASIQTDCPAKPQVYCKDCSHLTDPDDGTISFSSGTSYQSVASFACNTGYSLTGSPTRECQIDGTWSNENPNCTINDCGAITVPTNGSVDYSSGTTYGSVATLSCDTGFTLTGDVTRTCRADGSWSNSNPTCVKNDCGLLTPPSQGSILYSSRTTYQSVATFSCNTGYTLVGPATRTCQADRSWSNSNPTCDGAPDITGLGDSCTAPSDCSAVMDATCKNNICACKDGYRAISGTCVAEEGGDDGGTGGGPSTGLIVGAVIGVAAVAIIAVFLILLVYRHNRVDHNDALLDKTEGESVNGAIPNQSGKDTLDINKETPEVHRNELPTVTDNKIDHLTPANVSISEIKELNRETQIKEEQVTAGELQYWQPPMDTNFRQPQWIGFNINSIPTPRQSTPFHIYQSDNDDSVL